MESNKIQFGEGIRRHRSQTCASEGVNMNDYGIDKKTNELKDDINFHLSKMTKTPDYANSSLFWIMNANSRLAWFSFIQGNLIQMKQCFSNVGFIDIYAVEKYNDKFLDFDISRCLLPILSDNEEMIQHYSKLRYKAYGKRLDMDKYILKGDGAIFCNTIQFFMENNIEGVERNLNIFELNPNKTFKKSKTLEYDYEFYRALNANDKYKIEEVLEKIINPKFHKIRNDIPIISQYVSMPALGYAKLAWRKGIEVDVQNPLIPKELLPIQPNESYDIPYDFLK